ncbi:MAG TPA: diguanylate cyclase [Gemmatimonas sp.]|nr:diguanylate cyclase [Gemmatimonas sp.]
MPLTDVWQASLQPAEGVELPVRVLLIEDDADDYTLTRALLDRVPGTSFVLDWANSYEAGWDALNRGEHDVCLLDFQLGARTGLELLNAAITGGCRTPILLLTGLEDRDTDVAALQAGAADYLVKHEMTGPVLERALRYARQRGALLEEIRRLSVTDDMTGLQNRRGFHLVSAQRLREHAAGTDVLLMYADLDGLKSINDRFGHETGDAAIIAIADVLRRAFRGSDVIARLGGDEFVVLALDVPVHAEAEIAWRIKHHLDAHNASTLPDRQLSISSGFVRQPLTPTTSLPQLLAEADARMYEEKMARQQQRKDAASASAMENAA